jgi:hypothetical protein
MLTSTPVPQCLVQTTVPLASLLMPPSKQSDELSMLHHGDLQTCAKSEDMPCSASLRSNTNLDLFNKKKCVKKIVLHPCLVFSPN